jgi:hypothetical protein
VMATCSPRIGFTLAVWRHARVRRRHICQPPQAIPASPITHVDGSGTATGLARRKPKPLSSSDGPGEMLKEDDKLNGLLTFQKPPRNPRDEPEDASPSRSFH